MFNKDQYCERLKHLQELAEMTNVEVARALWAKDLNDKSEPHQDASRYRDMMKVRSINHERVNSLCVVFSEKIYRDPKQIYYYIFGFIDSI